MTEKKKIVIRGARTHNLKNINLAIPRNALVVITGPSGSGKSSIALDTIYAEGQRRYVESLSLYARHSVQQMTKPDVDSIEGLSPALAVQSSRSFCHPRSTVGTMTEVHDFLRLLFLRVGIVCCPQHHKPLITRTTQDIVDDLMRRRESAFMIITAPLQVVGTIQYFVQQLLVQGYMRIYHAGECVPIESILSMVNVGDNIQVVIDRLRLKNNEHIYERLSESISAALLVGRGVFYAIERESQEKELFSTQVRCTVPDCSYEETTELTIRSFSFNSLEGGCAVCHGLGVFPGTVQLFLELSLAEGAIQTEQGFLDESLLGDIADLARQCQCSMDMPFKHLPDFFQRIVLYGLQNELVSSSSKAFIGVLEVVLSKGFQKNDSYWEESQSCPLCHGSRLGMIARQVIFAGYTLHDLHMMPLTHVYVILSEYILAEHQKEVGGVLLKHILQRLQCLIDIGLGYLSLSRASRSLSGGELQRTQLSSHLATELTGMIYVLDEPSMGLHKRDTVKLLKMLLKLRDLGNTVIVVEHDLDVIKAADYIVDMGHGAGVQGGYVMVQGSYQELIRHPSSITGKYLSGVKKIEKKQGKFLATNWLILTGATGYTLKNVTCSIPLGSMTCISGVSGSGKSTLITKTLYPACRQHIDKVECYAEPYESLSGYEKIKKVVYVDSNLSITSRHSTPATYTGVMLYVRQIFASSSYARMRGYTAQDFSFNSKGGRCEKCKGVGFFYVDMHFLAKVTVPCHVCHGKRYRSDLQGALYHGKHIVDVMDMNIDDAAIFFHAVPTILNRLEIIQKVGLGYLYLGQSAHTLSSGETQRLKLAKELMTPVNGHTLYILDEPTKGLHVCDIDRLLQVLWALQNNGNTIVCIEHNTNVLKAADWLIDLGPDAGEQGGEIVAVGYPQVISANSKSLTGHYL